MAGFNSIPTFSALDAINAYRAGQTMRREREDLMRQEAFRRSASDFLLSRGSPRGSMLDAYTAAPTDGPVEPAAGSVTNGGVPTSEEFNAQVRNPSRNPVPANASRKTAIIAAMGGRGSMGSRVADAYGAAPVVADTDAAPAAAVAPSPANVAGGAPTQLVDPASLPARTDGLMRNDDAWRRMVKADPENALVLQQHLYNIDKTQAESIKARGQGMAMGAHYLLSLKKPDGSPDLDARRAAVPEVVKTLRSYGWDDSHLGGGALDGIDVSDASLQRYQMFGRDMSQVVDDERQDRRLDATIANYDADNTRADRNLDDVIADRAARRDITMRGQDMTDARGRYGIGVSSADRIRGQNLSSADRRRAQDMTDKRLRDTGGGSGRGGRPVLTTRSGVTVTPGGGAPKAPGTRDNPAVLTKPSDREYLAKGTYYRDEHGNLRMKQ